MDVLDNTDWASDQKGDSTEYQQYPKQYDKQQAGAKCFSLSIVIPLLKKLIDLGLVFGKEFGFFDRHTKSDKDSS